MKSMTPFCTTLLVLAIQFFAARGETAEGGRIKFKKTTLDTKFRSEGAAIGDFNNLCLGSLIL